MAADSVNFKINVEVDPGKAASGSKDVADHLGDAEKKAGDFEKALHRAFELFVSFEAAKKFLEFAEAADQVDDSIRSLVKDEEDLADVVEKLRVLSNEGGASLLTSAKAFRELTLASKEYGYSQEQILGVLRNVELGLRASGTSANEAQGAITALSLSLSQGEVSGRALRTIFTQLPAVADALSQKLGVTRSGLRELGVEGKISATDLLESLQKVDPVTEELAKKNGGLGAAYNELKNDLVEAAGEFDKATNLTKNLSTVMKGFGSVVLDVAKAFNALELSVEKYTDKVQKLNESEAKFNSVGAAIQSAQRELRALEGRQIISQAAIDRIAQLKAQLESLQGKAREINKVAEPKSPTAPEGGGTAETQAATDAARLRNAEDVKREKLVEDITKKLEDQSRAQRFLLNGDREGAELNALLSAQRDKSKKDLSDLNTQQTQRLLLQIKEKQALEDQAKAYQSIVGPAQEYERTQAALVELAKKHPELLKQVNQKLEENRLKFLETQKDLGSGFERAFLKMQIEAENFAAVAEKAVNSFADEAVNSINKFVETGKFDLAGFADAFIQDLERIAARALVVAAITALIPGFAPAAAAGGALAGAHASGGTEQPGRSYLVGENGPEIHTPGQTGSTAPINQGGNQKPVTVQIVNVTHPDEVPNAINGGGADQSVINLLARNPNKAKRALGLS